MGKLEELLDRLKNQSSTLQEKTVSQEQTEDHCPLCNNSGWTIREDDNGYLMTKECVCRKQRIMNNRLRFASLPEAFKDMRLKTFKTDVYRIEKSKSDIRTVVEIILIYMENLEKNIANGIGLYISSETKGSGKTRLAASIANELLQVHNLQVKFSVSTTILNEIKATWNKDSEYTESKLLDALSTTDILVIDDFGIEAPRDWINEKFYSIINERYINKKVTIFTSNFKLSELRYDDRIMSRIKEKVYEIPFPEESVREYIAEQNNLDLIQQLRK